MNSPLTASPAERRDLPWLLLLAYFFAAPWMYLVEFLPIPLSQVLGGLLTLVLVLYQFHPGRVKLTPYHDWLIAWIVWCAASTLWSTEPDYSNPRLLGLIKCFVVVMAAWQIAHDHRSSWKLVQAFLLGMMVSVLYTLAQYLSFLATFEGPEAHQRWRFAGAEYDPNTFSVVVAAALPLAAQAAAGVSSAIMRWIYISFLPLGWYAVILSASRTGLVCATFATSLLLSARFPNRGRMIVGGGLIVAAALSTGLVEVPSISTERLARTAADVQLGELSGRIEIWQAALHIFSDNFLTGVGWGAVEPSMYKFFYRNFAAHNTLLSIGAETGIIGLVLFGLGFGALGARARAQGAVVGTAPLVSLATLAMGSFALSFSTQQLVWAVVVLNTGLVFSDNTRQNLPQPGISR